jgi:hypothetical protein
VRYELQNISASVVQHKMFTPKEMKTSHCTYIKCTYGIRKPQGKKYFYVFYSAVLYALLWREEMNINLLVSKHVGYFFLKLHAYAAK